MLIMITVVHVTVNNAGNEASLSIYFLDYKFS